MHYLLVVLLMALAAPLAATEGTGEVTLTPGFKIQPVFENDETPRKDATFKIKRARATLDGQLAERLAAHATIETIDEDDGVVLLQGYAVYTLHRLLKLQAGQMYTPFGLENRRGFDKRRFYDRSFVTDGILREVGRRAVGSRSGRFRDVGIMAFGEAGAGRGFGLNYAVMLFNGNGILVGDNNDEKDVAARVQVTSRWGMAVGGSIYHGTYASADSSDYGEDAYGVELLWSGKILDHECRAQGEYIAASWEAAEGEIEPEGFYVQGTAFVTKELEAGMRYDRYEPDRRVGGDVVWERVSLALRYYFAAGTLLAADYEVRDQDLRTTDNRLTLHLIASF